jgi:hypothetical protein
MSILPNLMTSSTGVESVLFNSLRLINAFTAVNSLILKGLGNHQLQFRPIILSISLLASIIMGVKFFSALSRLQISIPLMSGNIMSRIIAS